MATQKRPGAELSEAETAAEDYANMLSDILDKESSARGYVVLFTHSE
jgi:CHASE3 domain sensor protein